MTDPQLTIWAETLANYSLDLKPGEQLLIRTEEAAIPLAKEVYRAALKAGAHPHIAINLAGQEQIFLTEAGDAQLDWVSPIRRMEYETIDALCGIAAPGGSGDLTGIDPARLTRMQKAASMTRRVLTERGAAGKAKWTTTLFPTPSAAAGARMSLEEYESFVFTAMLLDQPDPAAAWRTFSARQQHYVDYLNQVSTLRFVAEDTDITMQVGGRTWANSDGHRNFPSGEVFTGPIEDSVNGHVRFTFPSSRLGQEITEIQLTFQQGRVVGSSAAQGGTALEAMLETDPGARFLGEVAIGNNYGIQRYTNSTLYDEKIGGTFHLALGSAYPETGGKNVSAVHWDLVCDMRPEAGGGAVYADGVLIHENGQWTI